MKVVIQVSSAGSEKIEAKAYVFFWSKTKVVLKVNSGNIKKIILQGCPIPNIKIL